MTAKVEISVVVIGGGPGGMFFIHALNQLKQECNKNVTVTCYERTSSPGGIWRSPSGGNNNGTTVPPHNSAIKNHTDTAMYDQLWTNGPSHGIELYDYTFDEHFHSEPVTVYLKRQDLLEYMMGRVTKNCPHFFQNYFQFNKEVIHVAYNDDKQKFTIQVKDLVSDTITEHEYDKCLWACGTNGKQNIPQGIYNILVDGNYQGKIIHSSNANQLHHDVKGKRVLLIGGAYSAEDITLQSIKLGAEKVYVSCRLTSCEISWTSVWPMNKVDVLLGTEIKSITPNSKNIQLRNVEWTYRGYRPDNTNADGYDLDNIDTIIFCTGYSPNLSLLDDNLNQGFPGGEPYFSNQYPLEPPSDPDWKMKPNAFTELTDGDDIELSDELRYLTDIVHPNFYHGLLISNPNMMFMTEGKLFDNPLLSLDAFSWLFARYVTGLKEIPTFAEMKEMNKAKMLKLLHYPYYRYQMDENYCQAISELEDFWPTDSYEPPQLWNQIEEDGDIYNFQDFGNILKEAKHPFQILNHDNNEFNENGKALYRYNRQSFDHRIKLGADLEEDDEKEEELIAFRRTFRDYHDGDKFQSLHTGRRAVPLKCNWLDM